MIHGDEQRIGLVMQYIKANLKISELIKSFGRYSAEVNKGNYIMIACPFHEDALPSFSIDDKKGVCHCFSCGFGGTYVSVFRKLWKVVYYSDISFVSALDMIIEGNPDISARLGFTSVKTSVVEIVDSGFRSKRLKPKIDLGVYRVSDMFKDMKLAGLDSFDDIALAQAMMFNGIIKLESIVEFLKNRKSFSSNSIDSDDGVEFVSAADLLSGLMD